MIEVGLWGGFLTFFWEGDLETGAFLKCVMHNGLRDAGAQSEIAPSPGCADESAELVEQSEHGLLTERMDEIALGVEFFCGFFCVVEILALFRRLIV